LKVDGSVGQKAHLLHRKAAEHRRTPKRKTKNERENDGHVLECGSALPL
jgi:hypothetical protein